MTIPIGDLIAPFEERLGGGTEPVVLTLTEKQGFIPQAERFNKRLAVADTSKYRVVRRHDIAFNPYLLWAGALAQNTVCDVGVISPLYPTFRVREGNDPRYVGRLLLSPEVVAKYDGIAFGSVPRRRRSSVEDFLHLRVPRPPIESEQRRIAAILDTADALRAKRRATITALESLTQSIFLDMFGDPTIDGRWARVPLRRALLGIEGGRSPVCLARPGGPDEWSVLRLGAVSSGTYLEAENKAMKPGELPDRRHEVRAGDVLFSRKNTPNLVAMTVLVARTRHRLLLPDLLFRLVPGDGLHPAYLAAVLTDRRMRSQIQQLATGSAASMVNISRAKLLGVTVPIPRWEQQTAFAAATDGVLRARGRASEALDRLEALLASLEHRAFGGEL